MSDDKQTIGFLGLGRLGLPLAMRLLEAGYPVVTGSRGRSEELVAAGGQVAGDGTPRAVAEAAEIVVTCMPSAAALTTVIEGEDGILAAPGEAPLVVETSTMPVDLKASLREKVIATGGEMLDSPVSGTPEMVVVGIAVAYASGPESQFERASGALEAMSPNMRYAGDFGAGTTLKYIAQVLATIHVCAASEAMAIAALAGLDLERVARVLSESPGAASGQFAVRAPLIAKGEFEGRLVTVDMTIKDLDLIGEFTADLGYDSPLIGAVRGHFDDMIAAGKGQNDPAVLSQLLRDRAAPPS